MSQLVPMTDLVQDLPKNLMSCSVPLFSIINRLLNEHGKQAIIQGKIAGMITFNIKDLPPPEDK